MGKTKKPKMPKHKGIGAGMEKLFTEKPKRRSSALKLRGSTWLKKPPRRSPKIN